MKRTAPPEAGSWSVPAGYLEVSEPPADAAVRELYEETGVNASADNVKLHDTAFVEHPNGRTVLVLLYVIQRAGTTGTPVAGSNAAAAQFWNIETLIAAPDQRIESGYQELFQAALELSFDS